MGKQKILTVGIESYIILLMARGRFDTFIVTKGNVKSKFGGLNNVNKIVLIELKIFPIMLYLLSIAWLAPDII